MPLYEYECRNCKARFEHLVFDRAEAVTCRECGSLDIVQQLSTFAVGAEPRKSASRENRCAGCQGMQGGVCPMSME